jgi:hypothetical protein
VLLSLAGRHKLHRLEDHERVTQEVGHDKDGDTGAGGRGRKLLEGRGGREVYVTNQVSPARKRPPRLLDSRPRAGRRL